MRISNALELNNRCVHRMELDLFLTYKLYWPVNNMKSTHKDDRLV